MRLLLLILLASMAIVPTLTAGPCTAFDTVNTSSCKRCAAGYKLSVVAGTGSCVMCEVGKGRAADTVDYSADTTCNIPCSPECAICGASATTCLACSENFKYTLATKSCEKCAAGKTRVADSTIITADTTCDITCSPMCSICSGTATSCLGCSAGFKYTLATKSCSACEAGKGRGADTTEAIADTTCGVTCSGNCAFCGQTTTSCLGCAAGLKLDFATKTCNTCEAGKGHAADTAPQTADTTCDITCDPSCTFCSATATTCSGCSAGYKFTVATSTCSVCETGKGRAADTAPRVADSTCDVVCASRCTFCGDLATTCLGCSDGYKLVFASKTCTVCDAGKGRAADTAPLTADSTCGITCSPSCGFCGATSTACLGCSAGYKFSFATNACSMCETGKGRAADTEPQLADTACGVICQSTCVVCGAQPETCLGCIAGYRLIFVSKTCLPCVGGRGNPADTTVRTSNSGCLIECILGCEACTDTNTKCTRCSHGYYLSGDFACSMCPSGKGKFRDLAQAVKSTTSGAAECVATCHPSCMYCRGSTANDCLNCKAGYLFDGLGICANCPSRTTKYDDSWIIKREGISNDCDRYCNDACNTCTSTSSTTCLSCYGGYYWSGSNTCNPCPIYKGKATDLVARTGTSTDAECNLDCHPRCKHCFGTTSSSCLSCRAGFWRSTSNNSCNLCSAGYGKVEDTAVTQWSYPDNNGCPITCHSSCNNCAGTSSSQCLNCPGGSYLSASGVCTQCPDFITKTIDTDITGVVQTSSVCNLNCYFSCKKCSNVNSSNCLSCRAGYYWGAYGTCYACNPGTGKPADSGNQSGSGVTATDACTITTCHETCKICGGATANDCVLCKDGYYMSSAGVCTMCPLGKGKVSDTQPPSSFSVNQCTITCHATCRTCTSTTATSCLNCAPGYFYSGGGSCSACTLGKGKPVDTAIQTVATTSDAACTSTCDASCLTCQGSTTSDCLKCNEGHFRSGTNTCTMCPAGKGKTSDSVVVAISSDAGATECSIICHPTCRTCRSTAAGGCLNCMASFFFDVSSTCSPCEVGKGKAADTTLKTTVTTSTAACTTSCSASCQSCTSTDTQCTRCKAGMFMNAADTCSLCPYGSGKVIDTLNAAVSTTSGATECSVACDVSCAVCESNIVTGCLNCAAGSWWAGSGVCTTCANGKTKSKDTTIVTAATTETAACTLTCDSSCQVCSGSATNCDFCVAGFYYSAAGTCTACAAKRGKPADVSPVSPGSETTLCINCHQSCYKCKGSLASQCLACSAGFYLSGIGICSMCPTGIGKVDDSGTTLPTVSTSTACNLNCDATCGSCSAASSPTACLGCNAGYYFASTGVCTQCDLGFGKPADTTVPLVGSTSTDACTSKCHESCLTCKGPLSTDCLKCNSGFYLSAANTCSMCPVGFGKTADSTVQSITTDGGISQCTVTCDPTCRTCVNGSQTGCLNCNGGFFWKGAGACEQCDARKGKIVDTTIPTVPLTKEACTITCDQGCLVCSSTAANSCLKCTAGFFYSAALTCTMCPEKKGRIADTAFPTIATGTDACTVDCDPKCRTCGVAGPGNCLNCRAGFYYSGSGACSACALGKGKLADTLVMSVALTPAACSDTCHASCIKCKGSTAADCINCNGGFYLSAAGTCTLCPAYSGRPAGFITDTDYPIISITSGVTECSVACHQSCQNCKDATANGCLNCNIAHFYSAAGTCTLCDFSTGKLADTTVQTAVTTKAAACTVSCNGACSYCSATGNTNCISCRGSFYKSAATTCVECGPSKGKPNDALFSAPTTIPADACSATCHSSCISCTGSGPNDCVKCNAGYYLSAVGTCTMCPFGKGKLLDSAIPTISTTEGFNECTITCHQHCRTCTGTTIRDCLNCRAGYFWDNGPCTKCAANKGQPEDTTVITAPETADTCTTTCHASCQTCGGPTANDCTSCSIGYWWTGPGRVGKCTACPKSRGKAADTDLFPAAPATVDACDVFCDLCSSGCLTCGASASVCSSCIPGKFLTPDGTCLDCPENCITCTSALTCDTCAANQELILGGGGCKPCQVLNCKECKGNPLQCTKCNDKFTLKSVTECVYEPKPAGNVEDLSSMSAASAVQLKMNILENQIALDFDRNTQSRAITGIVVIDKLSGIEYTCQQIGCSYHFNEQDKLVLGFKPTAPISSAKVTIQRAGATGSRMLLFAPEVNRNNRRSLQTLASYPIVLDNVALMSGSRLATFGFVLRIIVGILRLPLSLAVYWRYPHLAMIMDYMVTNLRVYSMLGEPYMANSEVVFQSVTNSKVLPFNFANPFELWNPSTIDCRGYTGLRSKNMQCSWFDNYGQNVIGLLSVAVLCFILYRVGLHMAAKSQSGTWQHTLYATLRRDYGLKFLLAKLDANHLEIFLMTLIAYCTADSSSKSVTGMIVSTAGLLGFMLLGVFLTVEAKQIFEEKPMKAGGQYGPVKMEVVFDVNVDKLPPQQAAPESSPIAQPRVSVASENALEFTFCKSSLPATKYAAYFHLCRYIRALLMAIIVSVDRNPTEQVVLLTILESAYFAILLLLDHRGDRIERFFYAGMHLLILVHLILRAVATSPSLSVNTVHSVLSNMIAVVLIAYIFFHIITALLILIGVLIKMKPAEKQNPDQQGTNKLEYAQQKLQMLEEDDNLKPEQNPQKIESLPAVTSPSQINLDFDIPEEFGGKDEIPQEFTEPVRNPTSGDF